MESSSSLPRASSAQSIRRVTSLANRRERRQDEQMSGVRDVVDSPMGDAQIGAGTSTATSSRTCARNSVDAASDADDPSRRLRAMTAQQEAVVAAEAPQLDATKRQRSRRVSLDVPLQAVHSSEGSLSDSSAKRGPRTPPALRRRDSTFELADAAAAEGGMQRGDPTISYVSSLVRRCVRKRISPNGLFMDPSGVRVDIVRLPWCSVPISRLDEYGCPIAVYLYLRFLIEAGGTHRAPIRAVACRAVACRVSRAHCAARRGVPRLRAQSSEARRARRSSPADAWLVLTRGSC